MSIQIAKKQHFHDTIRRDFHLKSEEIIIIDVISKKNVYAKMKLKNLYWKICHMKCKKLIETKKMLETVTKYLEKQKNSCSWHKKVRKWKRNNWLLQNYHSTLEHSLCENRSVQLSTYSYRYPFFSLWQWITLNWLRFPLNLSWHCSKERNWKGQREKKRIKSVANKIKWHLIGK